MFYILNLTMLYDNYTTLKKKAIAIFPVLLLWKKFIFIFREIRKEKEDQGRQ